jgi:hypothetical protein
MKKHTQLHTPHIKKKEKRTSYPVLFFSPSLPPHSFPCLPSLVHRSFYYSSKVEGSGACLYAEMLKTEKRSRPNPKHNYGKEKGKKKKKPPNRPFMMQRKKQTS